MNTSFERRGRVASLSLIRLALVVAGGLAAAPGVAAPPVMLSDVARGQGGFVINGSFQYGFFGSVVSGGADTNGDGLSDVLVGFRASQSPAMPQPDLNHVVFGKPDGGQVNLWTIAAGGTQGFAFGQDPTLTAFTQLGVTASMAGDMNGDGLGDMVLTPRTAGALDSLTRRFVVFGRTNSGLLSLSDLNAGTGGYAVRGGTVGIEILGPPTCELVTGLGDVNGDGLNDVLLAAAGAPSRSYVVFGHSSGAPPTHTQVQSGTGGFLVEGASIQISSNFIPAGIGDVNGDGLNDIGFPNMVIFGRTATSPISASNLGDGPSRAGWLLTSASSGLQLRGGGDINGDGLDDILAFPAWGQANGAVVFGRAETTDLALSDVRAGTGGFAVNFAITTNFDSLMPRFGVSEAGDINGDGLADFVIGAGTLNGFGSPYSSTGLAYVLFGRTSTTALTVPTSTNLASTLGFVINSANSRARYAGAALAPGGDIDGDGLADLIVGAHESSVSYSSLPSRLTPTNHSTGQIYAVFNPLDPAPSSTYIANVPAGNPGTMGPGGRSFGRDTTIHVDGRAWVDFADGTGPGQGGSSTLGVTITRSDDGIGGGLDLAKVANVQWSIASNRTNAAPPRVIVRYTNAEIAGLNEGGLQLLTAPTAAGPFVPVGAPQLDPTRNTLSGTATLPAMFIIVDGSPRATITRLNENPTLEQNPSWLVTFDKPLASTFSPVDLAPTGSLAGSYLIDMNLSGVDPSYVVQAITTRSPLGGTIGFTIPVGAVSSGGLGNPAAIAPEYTIQGAQPVAVAGDVNRDAVVNVEDVTALANHIVNGTPLP